MVLGANMKNKYIYKQIVEAIQLTDDTTAGDIENFCGEALYRVDILDVKLNSTTTTKNFYLILVTQFNEWISKADELLTKINSNSLDYFDRELIKQKKENKDKYDYVLKPGDWVIKKDNEIITYMNDKEFRDTHVGISNL